MTTRSQYPCLGNPVDRGAWRAAVHGVTKNQTTTTQINLLRSPLLPIRTVFGCGLSPWRRPRVPPALGLRVSEELSLNRGLGSPSHTPHLHDGSRLALDAWSVPRTSPSTCCRWGVPADVSSSSSAVGEPQLPIKLLK